MKSIPTLVFVFCCVWVTEMLGQSFPPIISMAPDTARALALARYANALVAQQPDSARWYGQMAIEYAQRSNDPVAELEACYAVADASFNLHLFKEASEAYRRVHELLGNSLDSGSIRKHLVDLRMQYETAQKQAEISTLRQQKKANRNAMIAIGLATFLLSLLGFAIFRNYRRTRQFARISEVQKKALEQSNTIKDALFSVVSHELRSPLNSIKAFIQMRLQTGVGEEEKGDFERLDRQIGETITLLDNLLHWSAVQTRRLQPQFMPLHLKDLAEETAAMLHQDADRKNIRIELDIPPGLVAFGDVNMIRAVFRNLIHNAIKFSPSGADARISVRARNVGDKVEVSVHNSGSPIPRERQMELFGSGYSSPGTAGEKGAGIGLQLCKEFVEGNRGQISFSSTAENGTDFTFQLPAAKT